VFKLNN